MRRAALLGALLVAWAGAASGQAPSEDPFAYPEHIIRAEGAREGAVSTANVDPEAPAKPLRLIVRYPRGVHLDAAAARLLASPAAALFSAPGDAPLSVAAINAAAGSSDGGSSSSSGEASGAPLSSVPGVRIVKRLRGGGVRGVLLELPPGTRRGDALAALKAVPDVSDVEVEGIVTVQIAKVLAAGGGGEVQPGLFRVGLATTGILGRTLVQPTVSADSSVTVAVVDTGVDRSHPDINVVGGKDFTPDNDYGLDGNGHGTHVAGIIGARNNGAGIVGALPGAPIYSLKVLSAAGQGTTTDVVDALNWVADSGRDAGVRVVNLSLSGPKSKAMCDAIRAVVAKGITVVAAAGNNGMEINAGSPADCAHALVVTAMADYDGKPGGLRQPPAGPGAPTTKDDSAAAFSNYATARSPRVVAAPGVHILSTVPPGRCGALKCTAAGPYAYLSGTSMAAPLVSGIAAACYNAGACAAPRASSATTVADAFFSASREARARGFAGDPNSPVAGKYYGYLAAAPW